MKSNDFFQKDPVIKRFRDNSSFGAVKNLVQAENNVRVAHNRIKVLQINDNKNNSKIANQIGLIQKIEKVRQFSAQHHNYLEATKQQMQREEQQSKTKLLQVSEKHKIKLKEVYDDLKKGRKWQYLSIEEQSEEAERLIKKNRSKEQRQKQMHRSRITDDEQACRQSLVKFQQQKQQKIRSTKMLEVKIIKTKQQQKHKELRDLSNLQMQLIQRQSQSQAAYQEVKGKLDSMLNVVKQQHTKSKKSLKTSIHFQSRTSQMDE